MAKLYQRLSLLLLIASWVGLIGLLCTDGIHRLHFTPAHQRLSALALIFIGLSYGVFQFAAVRRSSERLKGLLLATAFVLWGSEQFLPASPIMTLLDSVVIGIFVVDISLVIVDRLKNPPPDHA
jgi:hypothetical protein